jgi:cysteinyl-tRNA synthetase
MKIHNTLSGKLEEFIPVNKDEVSMYVCGPTVYNYIHIGNARPLIFFDTVRRYLEYKGYKVKFVQNFTDVDDKMIEKANQEGKTVKEIAELYIKEYFEDTKKLNIKEEGMIRPKATENIKEMIRLVKTLEEKGNAYEANGDVYFDIESYKDYGKLSHQKIEELISGSRIEVNTKKKNPLDFTLWKRAKENEPKWPSPWGEGRPGWHLECSAMSAKYLGNVFDIHGGGQDLIFPHHENEIAQSVCATGENFANYWMHNGYINIRGEKMSKSKNNFFLLRDILKEYEGDIVRFFMLSSHYRKPIEFSEEELKMAKSGLERLRNTKTRIEDTVKTKEIIDTSSKADILDSIYSESKTKFEKALDEDFNTAMAIGAIFELTKSINKTLDENKKISEKDYNKLNDILSFIKTAVEEVLGVSLENKIAISDKMTFDLIDFLVEMRWNAKKDKNWELADRIREKLASLGIEIKDQRDKSTWKI